MGTESGSTSSIMADPGVAAPIGVANPHSDVAHPRPAANKRVPPRRTAAYRRTIRPTRGAIDRALDKVLSEAEFESSLHRETRRAERSGTSLSLVLYRFAEQAHDELQHFEHLLGALHHSKRETDVVGHFGTDTIAILCPDTNEAGVQGFRRKLDALTSGLPVSVAEATYPDHLFERLSSGKTGRDALNSFVMAPGALPSVGAYTGKRLFDIVTALFMLALLGLPMLVVALIVKLSSHGPIIFKQPRLGKGGVPFTFYKFRSMVVNVDDRIHREYMATLIRGGHAEKPSDAAEQAIYKMKADPRVTRIGKFIRMASIDELPQLFNVLKGDMSMVGPRPPIPYEAAHYEPWHLRRILVAKPGITGLWQVEGRSRVTFSEMVRMDLRYIRQCSLRLDLKILLKTIGVVLRRDGAR